MDDVLKKFIEIAPYSGFSKEVLLESCILCDKANDIIRFEDGVYSALKEIDREINLCVTEKFAECSDSSLGVSGKIKLAIDLRLQHYRTLKNYREFLKEKIKFFSSPKHCVQGVKQLYCVADFMWKLIDDRSTDFNFYSKRITLSILHKNVIKKFANDFSHDFIETSIYLDEQLKKIGNFTKIKHRIKNLFR